jgi:transcriptional regulator with GAF, ATPase, and Fis domain
LASSTEATRLLELFQLQAQEGPCLDCFHTGEPVSVPSLSEARDRWPIFVPAAQQRGFASVHAIPLRLGNDVIGAMNMFSATTGDMAGLDLLVAQALADVATISILQERSIEDRSMVAELTRAALESRQYIEQGKGMIAGTSGLNMADSYARLRRYADTHNISVTQVGRALSEGRLASAAVLTEVPGEASEGTEDEQ